MEEPSVLDYIIDKLTFWRESTLEIPEEGSASTGSSGPKSTPRGSEFPLGKMLGILGSVILALLAQRVLEPPTRSPAAGLLLYIAAAAGLVYLALKGTWKVEPLSPDDQKEISFQVHWHWLAAGLLVSMLAWLLFLGNRFTIINVSLWGMGFGLIWKSLWIPENGWSKIRAAWEKFRTRGLQISSWNLLVLLVFGVAAFYRFYRLSDVPPEMFSDHAEKLIDVTGVLRGQHLIFFPRNTGREAFQMYLTAGVARIFGTGISFLSLKIGTCLAGLFTLPFIYLLGKEIAGKEVGLLAMGFAGIAYWPNVISRVALRFALYPFFAAPLIYFLIRGLKRKRRNDFLLAGAALGMGLHGYSTFRIVPLLVIVILGIYALHASSRRDRRMAFTALLLIGLISLVLFLPLLRYAMENYQRFSYRMMTRLSGVEVPLPGPPLEIFFRNLSRVLVMFQWDNGVIWVHSVPTRPALDWVAAGLFTMGVILVILRYLKDRHWVDLTLLLSIPVLLLPSALSLAFPQENPSLNRTGGAVIPVFLIVGMMGYNLYRNLGWDSIRRWGQAAALPILLILVLLSGMANYHLVFDTYYNNFRNSAWNTSELGEVIQQFTQTVGDEDQVWVVPYPHWVDTRLVGIRAVGEVQDFALGQEEISQTAAVPAPKMFLFKLEDQQTAQLLRDLYPEGFLNRYSSKVPSRDFMIFTVLD